MVNADDVAMTLIRRLERRVSMLPAEKMRAVEDALAYALDLPSFAR